MGEIVSLADFRKSKGFTVPKLSEKEIRELDVYLSTLVALTSAGHVPETVRQASSFTKAVQVLRGAKVLDSATAPQPATRVREYLNALRDKYSELAPSERFFV